jgi:predicted nucleotidyltransferase
MAQCETDLCGGSYMPDSGLHQDPVLAEIVSRLVEAYQPERIYRFGSRARGDAGSDSDYDLLVVAPDDAPAARRDGKLAYEALWGVAASVDAVVCRSSWFHARTHLKASLPGTVLREGRLLHGA